ncbi:hypothetical protein QQ008_14730 [Fulvivirgaceae bacterium BMA10]|uniref:Sulfatase N-terminal domain-containing protein n=1 Tax=Splendidivirga corallicola TaxID=3051826 RepID=A0ABT8KPH4_9BACT|nr:hypothetical protein [Fulvivirgaceae bacterium BMA10]
MDKRTLFFWLYFFLLNLLLFLPRYLMDFDHSTFFPDFSLEETFSKKWELFFRRNNNDIFKLSVDLTFLTFIFYLFRKRLPFKGTLFVFFIWYLTIFIYQLYQGIIEIVYDSEPLFYNDWYLAGEGMSILTSELNSATVVLVGLLFLFAIFMLFLLANRFAKNIFEVQFGWGSKVFGLLLILITALAVVNYRTRLETSTLTFSSQGYFIKDNAARSIKIRKLIKNMDVDNLSKHYDYSHYQLVEKPNLYILFIESYGKILYDHPQLKESHLNDLLNTQKILRDSTWFSVSGFSRSPVKGAGSWLSYTSFLMGTTIDKHIIYRSLLAQKNTDFPHLFGIFKTYGYEIYRLSSLPDTRKDIPYSDYTRFYKIDHWISYHDLNYVGKKYGWGPSPPDQYSLNFAHDLIKDQQEKEPFVLFFIDVNSHNPFASPTNAVDDWRSLNRSPKGLPQDSDFFSKPTLENYQSAIKYQLDYLSQFIVKNGSENDIFLLIGDHQPPLLASDEDGFETPVHIIAKDSTFIGDFVNEGFQEGLIIEEGNRAFNHAGLYSLFMRQVIKNYGIANEDLPVFFPEGVKLNN